MKNNAKFIAHARTDIPRLLSALNTAMEGLREIAAKELTKHRVYYLEGNDDSDPIAQYEMGQQIGEHYQAERAQAILTAINNPQEISHE